MGQIVMHEDTHRYYDNETFEEYLSVSFVLKMLEPKVDWEMVKFQVAKSRGITVEEVQTEWDKPTKSSQDTGKRIHNALEEYDRYMTIKPENEDLRPLIMAMREFFCSYKTFNVEQILSSEKYRIAGTVDKRCKINGGKTVDYFDYKTNEVRGIQYHDPRGKFMNAPVAHLSNCNYNKYALQPSFYAYFGEEMEGLIPRKNTIIFIPPSEPMKWYTIPMPYMKNDVLAILEYYKQDILDEIENRKSTDPIKNLIEKDEW